MRASFLKIHSLHAAEADGGLQQRDAGSTTSLPASTRTELARRSSGDIDVTLVWVRRGGADEALVCVSDRREGTYFEVPAEPYRALDVYYHPFAYRATEADVNALPAAGRS